MAQSCPLVGLTHGLGRDFSVFGGLGWVLYSRSTEKIRKDYVDAFKIWLHQAAKFDLTTDLTTKL